MAATSVIGPTNKAAAHWARKIYNRKLRKTGILDTGATSGAAPEENKDCFADTGIPSTKIFMFPDKRTNKATKKMLMKHNLCESAREMNIVPGLHSTLISILKLADAGYTTVFTKKGAAIYDDYTTKITTSKPPVLNTNRCNHTGLWKLTLDDQNKENHKSPPENKAKNVIFDLPSTRQSFLWYHAAAGWPPKETFLTAFFLQRQLCNMAKADRDAHPPVHARLGRDSQRTPQGSTTRHPVDEEQGFREVT